MYMYMYLYILYILYIHNLLEGLVPVQRDYNL